MNNKRSPQFQIRIHGRGGQGVVTSAELISIAAFNEHQYSQAFPSFGSERMGAPVVSYCRISPNPIRTHEPVTQPDCIIIQDPTLIHQIDVFEGITKETFVLINTVSALESPSLQIPSAAANLENFVTVPASAIAQKHIGKDVMNVPMLGALAAFTGIVSLESVKHAVRERFPGSIGEFNILAAEEAYSAIQDSVAERR